MPFWWRRRRKPWYGRWKRRRTFRRYKRRRFPRRRRRRITRRRRKRRKKVRRKRKTLPVKQWQPACIRKCKIKGVAAHIVGTQGRQFNCFTDNAGRYTPALQPGGGGFAVEKFTLQHLYNEHKMGRNIWTQSNKYLDLTRYLGGKIIFWRHPHVDFILNYNTSLPMNLDKYTYPNIYPQQMLLARKKKIVPSLLTKPTGKRYVTIKFKPPKLLTNKWLFQEALANTGLLQLQATIADLRYPHLGCCNTNQMVTLTGINLQYYSYFAWGHTTNPYTPTQPTNWYIPNPNAAHTLEVKYPGMPKGMEYQTINIPKNSYSLSVGRTSGFFRKELLTATEIKTQTVLPGTFVRYNPVRDNGVGNKAWLVSVLNTSTAPPQTDKELIIEGLPLYQLLLGFTDYVTKIKKEPNFLQSYCLFLQSPYFEPHQTTWSTFCPIDYSFMTGKGPYDSNPTLWDENHWFPTVKHQQKSINNIVSSGPYMPKLENQNLDTWELWSNYYFYFKFGGEPLPDAEAADPGQQGTYPVPNNVHQTIQISNPEKTSSKATLHAWDFRRGIVTAAAFKRMCENQQTDTDFQTDAEPPKKKKKTFPSNALQVQEESQEEIQSCLLSLCKSDTSQESKEDNLKQLIYNQQQQQLQLKNNLLKLITDLKKKQKLLQLQTGVLD
nr:MAG: ORF1 [Torque teno midi virus]